MKILILSSTNHNFGKSTSLINDFLGATDDLDTSLEDNKTRDGDGPVRWARGN